MTSKMRIDLTLLVVFVHQTSHLNRGEKYTQVLHELFPLTVLSIWASLSILFLTHLLAKQLYNIVRRIRSSCCDIVSFSHLCVCVCLLGS